MSKRFEKWWDNYYRLDNPNCALNHPKGDCKIIWDIKEKKIRELQNKIRELKKKLK